jgi:hypothetical protein
MRDIMDDENNPPFKLGAFYHDKSYQLFYCYSFKPVYGNRPNPFVAKLLNVNDIITENINSQTFKIMKLDRGSCWSHINETRDEQDLDKVFEYQFYNEYKPSTEHSEFMIDNINHFLNKVKVD